MIDRRTGGFGATVATLLAWGACHSAGARPAVPPPPALPTAALVTPVRLSSAVMRDGARVLPLTVRLAGGGGRDWVSESCNPVVPVMDGKPRPLRVCITNFWSRVSLRDGRGESPLEWPLDAPQYALKPGGRIAVAIALATDCRKSHGPGLFAMGDCKTVETVTADAAVEP